MATNDPGIRDPLAHPELSITLGDSTSESKGKRALDLELGQLNLEIATTSRPRARPDKDSIEAVLAFPTFLQALTAQDILSIKCVSRDWATWFANNINTIALARRQKESVDWYFPLLDKVIVPPQLWQMTGIWHAGEEYTSESKLCKLPPTGYKLPLTGYILPLTGYILPLTGYILPPSTLNMCICDLAWSYIVKALVASGGGLLMTKTWACGRHYYNIHHNIECVHRNRRWSRSELVVTNPHTKQCKLLPAFIGSLGHTLMSSYYQHHHFIVVDDIANTYKVLIFRCPRLDVYDSMSNTWQSFGDILRDVQPSLGAWSTSSPQDRIYLAVCMGGCLYIADIREATNIETSLHPKVIGAIRLFKVEIETGESNLSNEILICATVNHPSVKLRPVNAASILRNLELVETLGRLFAIIPARLDHLLYVYKPNEPKPQPSCEIENLSFMPLQFFIFGLTGGGCGVILMEVPESQRTTSRRHSLLKKTFPSEFKNERRLTPRNNWFACMAKGRVIWLTVEDYLVEYDIRSRECKTEFLVKPEGTEEVVGLPYRVSFHMEP